MIKKIQNFKNKESPFFKKFIYRDKNFWPYIRVYLINKLYNQETVTIYKSTNVKRFIKDFFRIIYSFKNLKQKENLFLIANRNEVNNLLKQFNIQNKIDDKNSVYMSFKGNSNYLNKNYFYFDFFKIYFRVISSLIFFKHRNKSSKYIVKKYFLEGVLFYYFYKCIFWFIKPKNIYLINWYNYYPAILGNNSAKIHEIQHGIIHKSHWGYNLNCNIDIDIPNVFHLWDSFSKDNISIGNQTINYKYFKKIFQFSTDGDRSTCVIISQFSIKRQLNDFLIENIHLFKNYKKIIYRIHPKDEKNILEISKNLKEKFNLQSLEFSLPSEDLSSVLFLNYDYFGVFSTVLKDLIENKFNVNIIKIDGFQAMDDYFNFENVNLIK